MGKSVSGEDRQLLTADQSSQSVDGRDTGTDIVSRVFTGYRVQRQAVDIQTALCLDLSQSVDGLSDTVEGTSQDISGKEPPPWGVRSVLYGYFSGTYPSVPSNTWITALSS